MLGSPAKLEAMKPWQIALIVVGILCILCCGGGGIVTYLGFDGKGPLAGVLSDPFQLLVEHPTSVGVGDEFDVEIEVINSSDGELAIRSVDLEETFLGGFEVISFKPAAEDTDAMLGWMTWYLDPISISPGGSQSLTIRLRATDGGIFLGDLDVCTPNETFTTYPVSIRVQADE